MAQPVSAPELEALLQQLLRPVRLASSVRVQCAAAGDYAAGDVMSSIVTDTLGRATYVPNLALDKGGLATIVTIRARCSIAAVANNLRLHFFKQAPLVAEVEMDDNAVFALTTAAGRDNHVGSILLSAFVSRGGVGATSDNTDLLQAFVCDPNDAGLWMVVVTEQIEANEAANMTYDLDFYCR